MAKTATPLAKSWLNAVNRVNADSARRGLQALGLPTSPDEVARLLRDQSVNMGVNAALNGKLNNTGTVTLTAGATSTTVTEIICTAQSHVFLVAESNTAAGTTGLYVTPGNGSFVVHHNNTADTDRTFGYAVLG